MFSHIVINLIMISLIVGARSAHHLITVALLLFLLSTFSIIFFGLATWPPLAVSLPVISFVFCDMFPVRLCISFYGRWENPVLCVLMIEGEVKLIKRKFEAQNCWSPIVDSLCHCHHHSLHMFYLLFMVFIFNLEWPEQCNEHVMSYHLSNVFPVCPLLYNAKLSESDVLPDHHWSCARLIWLMQQNLCLF